MESRICNNPNCTKTHCGKIHAVGVKNGNGTDFNPDNKFTCPNYEPLYKKRSGAGIRPTIVARYLGGKMVKEYINN